MRRILPYGKAHHDWWGLLNPEHSNHVFGPKRTPYQCAFCSRADLSAIKDQRGYSQKKKKKDQGAKLEYFFLEYTKYLRILFIKAEEFKHTNVMLQASANMYIEDKFQYII